MPTQPVDLAGAIAAQRFAEELYLQFESLGEIVEQYGARTLTDLMYLQSALLDHGFIDAWEEDSNVLKVLQQLPSSERWLRHVSVYDRSGDCVSEAACLKDGARQADERSGKETWERLCNEQGWNTESQIVHLEGFLQDQGLMAEFSSYAQVAADEENGVDVEAQHG